MMLAISEVVPAKSSMLLVLQRQNCKDHNKLSRWTELRGRDVLLSAGSDARDFQCLIGTCWSGFFDKIYGLMPTPFEPL